MGRILTTNMKMFIRPLQKTSSKVFLKNTKGNYVSWSKVMRNHYNGHFTKSANGKFVTVSTGFLCREQATSSLYYAFAGLKLPNGYTITVVPPAGEDNIAVLTTRVGGSSCGLRVPSSGNRAKDTYQRGYALATSKSNMRQVCNLMDVVLGSAAMLMSGPSAYVRPKVGLNKRYVMAGEKTSYLGMGPMNKQGYRTRNTKMTQTKIAETTLKYTGISGFFLSHPASFSIITGLSKNCLQMWFDGLYEKIDSVLGITATKRRLASMSRKRKLSAKDKEELICILDVIKPYLQGARSVYNPGGYPLNKNTYTMFLRYIKVNSIENVGAIWENELRSGRSTYSVAGYGFAKWCKNQKTTTKELDKANTYSWSGLRGLYVSLAGHGR